MQTALEQATSKAESDPLPVRSEKTRSEATTVVIGLYSKIVEGNYPGVGNQTVLRKLVDFTNQHTR
ncbi:hypothetical protein DF196_12680 [Bifidobacterium callitrichidarum]|uniref:Uncharacterized protein n=1 Tax=Bifidobacterium callitrichidarum TaxID=2052941 RepID=A0A2U2MYR4_9BIFI|nr:hypothetical protein DF196_12680 [Bifidobacterium callitrichidarum]